MRYVKYVSALLLFFIVTMNVYSRREGNNLNDITNCSIALTDKSLFQDAIPVEDCFPDNGFLTEVADYYYHLSQPNIQGDSCNCSKDTCVEVFTFNTFDKASAYAKEKMEEGYTIRFCYDSRSKTYTVCLINNKDAKVFNTFEDAMAYAKEKMEERETVIITYNSKPQTYTVRLKNKDNERPKKIMRIRK